MVMAQSMISSSLLDTFGGLPVHPLAVHGAVVLLPLSALALALLIFVPKWRKNFFPLTLIGLGLSTVFTYIAKESGEALGERVGEPQTHEALGTILFPASVGLLALGVAFYFLQRKERPKWQLQAAAGLALAGIISVSALTYFVGHSGAEATWASRIAPYETPAAEATPTTEPSEAATTDPTSPSSPAGTFTAAEVAKHNTGTDCWSVVNNKVYDLTSYVSSHPGGANVIEAICGKDGTAAFSGQHGGAAKPNNVLDGFLLGELANSSAGTTTLQPAPAQNGEGEENEQGENY